MPLKQTQFDFDMFESATDEIPAMQDSGEETVKDIPVTVIPNVKEHEVKHETLRKSTRGRMKLSDMNADIDNVKVPEDAVLFEKSYYSIGAVSEMFGLNQSLIRYWENEFDILKPKKNRKGDRFFRPEDIKNLKLIYHLLRERKYTIEGAKEFLKKNKKADAKFEMAESLKKIKSFLTELKANL